MPLLNTDILWRESANIPTDDVSTSGGDINSVTVPDETTPSSIIPTMAIPTTGSDIFWYYKMFLKNNNGSSDLIGANGGHPIFYIPNGLVPPVVTGPVIHQGVSASETGSVKYMFKSGGSWLTTPESIAVTGTTPVSGVNNVDVGSPIYAQHVSNGGSLLPSVGNILISIGGTQRGLIPTGYFDASSLYTLGLDLTVNNTLSTVNRLTAPVGIAFSQAYTAATAIQIAGPANLNRTQYIGIWFKLQIPVNMVAPLTKLDPLIYFEGVSS